MCIAALKVVFLLGKRVKSAYNPSGSHEATRSVSTSSLDGMLVSVSGNLLIVDVKTDEFPRGWCSQALKEVLGALFSIPWLKACITGTHSANSKPSMFLYPFFQRKEYTDFFSHLWYMKTDT